MSKDDKKKLSMQEIIQQQLEKKKQAQGNGKNQGNGFQTNQRMKSQQFKKTTSTRRKMGS
jgi:hypothetical protein